MKKLTPSRVREFSKRILASMAVMWFAGALYGMITETIILFVTPEMFSLAELLVYVGTPVTCGLMTYLVKSAIENKEKIKQDYNPDYGAESTEVDNGDGV